MHQRRAILACLVAALATACSQIPTTPAPVVSVEGRERSGVPEIYRPIYEGGIGLDEIGPVRASLPYDSISLERTRCLGTCPIYTFTVHRSGAAELNAVEFLPTVGKYVGEVDIFSYGRLCYLLDHSGFETFRDRYEAPWTDAPTSIVTAVRKSGVKRVADYGSVGPIELWAIQEALDSVRTRIKWRPAS